MKFIAKTLITNLVNRLAYKAGHSTGSGKCKHATDYKTVQMTLYRRSERRKKKKM